MLFFNVFKMSFTDLIKSSYTNSFKVNDDSSGFVYVSEKEKHDLVFYPVSEGLENVEELATDLSRKLWLKNLPYSVAPFLLSLLFVYLTYTFLEPFSSYFAAGLSIILFLIVLYLSKISLSIIGAALNYKMLMNDQFKVLPLYQGLGEHSTIADSSRARPVAGLSYSPLSNNSEILANSHFVQTRMFKEKNIIKDPNDSRGTTMVFEEKRRNRK